MSMQEQQSEIPSKPPAGRSRRDAPAGAPSLKDAAIVVRVLEWAPLWTRLRPDHPTLRWAPLLGDASESAPAQEAESESMLRAVPLLKFASPAIRNTAAFLVACHLSLAQILDRTSHLFGDETAEHRNVWVALLSLACAGLFFAHSLFRSAMVAFAASYPTAARRRRVLDAVVSGPSPVRPKQWTVPVSMACVVMVLVAIGLWVRQSVQPPVRFMVATTEKTLGELAELGALRVTREYSHGSVTPVVIGLLTGGTRRAEDWKCSSFNPRVREPRIRWYLRIDKARLQVDPRTMLTTWKPHRPVRRTEFIDERTPLGSVLLTNEYRQNGRLPLNADVDSLTVWIDRHEDEARSTAEYDELLRSRAVLGGEVTSWCRRPSIGADALMTESDSGEPVRLRRVEQW